MFSAAWHISSRHSDRDAGLQRTGHVSISAARAAKGLRGRPGAFFIPYQNQKSVRARIRSDAFFCSARSALHLLAKEARHSLRELALRLAGRAVAVRGHEQHAAEHVALGEDGRGDGDGVALVGVDDRQRAAVGRILPARAHELFKLAADAPVEQLALAAAGHGDDRVAVAHGGDAAGGLVQRVADLRGELGQLAHGGILFENDLSVGVGVDLQRVALADTHGAADLLGDDHAAEVV